MHLGGVLKNECVSRRGREGKRRGTHHEEETVCKHKGYENKWCVFREGITNLMWLDPGQVRQVKRQKMEVGVHLKRA